MAVETSLYSLSTLNQHKNGVDFASNTSDVNTDFAALIGEKVRVISQINLTWHADGNHSDPWDITAGAIYRPGGSFLNDGFQVGQKFQFYSDWAARITGTQEFTATIDTIQQSGKYTTFTVNSGTQTTTGSAQTNVGIWADLGSTPGDAPDAIFFQVEYPSQWGHIFQHIPNNRRGANLLRFWSDCYAINPKSRGNPSRMGERLMYSREGKYNP